jgi:hypothetical protein
LDVKRVYELKGMIAIELKLTKEDSAYFIYSTGEYTRLQAGEGVNQALAKYESDGGLKRLNSRKEDNSSPCPGQGWRGITKTAK